MLTCPLPTPVSDCPVALALCSLSCSVPLSRGASALNRFICVTWRNLINCYLSLFSLVSNLLLALQAAPYGWWHARHALSLRATPRFRHTRYRSRYRFRQHAHRFRVCFVNRRVWLISGWEIGSEAWRTQIPSGALGPSPTVGDGAQCRRQLGAPSPCAAQLVRVLPRPLSSSRRGCNATAACRRAPRCIPRGVGCRLRVQPACWPAP